MIAQFLRVIVKLTFLFLCYVKVYSLQEILDHVWAVKFKK